MLPITGQDKLSSVSATLLSAVEKVTSAKAHLLAECSLMALDSPSLALNSTKFILTLKAAEMIHQRVDLLLTILVELAAQTTQTTNLN